MTEQFAVLWALFTVIVLGNSAVLVTLLLNKNRKSRMNFFIKQLAIADLCVGLLSVLTDIIWRMTVSWKAGNVACKAIRFAQASVTYASTYVLVALSIDRYDAITHPMNFSGCWNRARRLVAAAWSLSALFSLPIFYLYQEKSIQGRKQCWIDLGEAWRWQVYMCWVASSLFVLPALIISACYAIIVKTIWAKGAIMGPIDRTRNGIADLASRRASSRGIIPKAKVKTVKMTIVIVIVFVLCWSPYIVFDLLQVFGQIPDTQTNIAIATFIQSLAPLNSAANPLIYCLFSTQVCRMIKTEQKLNKSLKGLLEVSLKELQKKPHKELLEESLMELLESSHKKLNVESLDELCAESVKELLKEFLNESLKEFSK
ncbi:hypothetical protein RP20_CCG018794 [Aedes albopictus]|nr:hypothetical protein RP20_CCG018794 [Aedes albopictus]